MRDSSELSKVKMVMDILFSVVKGIKDHMNIKAVVDILTKDLWSPLNNQRNAKIDYLHFLHCCEYEKIKSYIALANYTNIILYMKMIKTIVLI